VKPFIITLLLILPLAPNAHAKDELIWHDALFAPYMFYGTDLDGSGDCDGAMYKAMEMLPEYHNVVRSMPLARFLDLLKSRPNYCFSCLYKTPEREEFMYFSKPFSYSESNMLITRPEDAALFKPFLDQDGFIDLKKLLESGKITVSVIHKRSYGAMIDAILEPYRDADIVPALTSATSLATQLRRLLTLKAYHAILGHPAEFAWNAKEEGLDLTEFRVYPIKGNDLFDQKSYTYFGCSKSDLGKKVIDVIDANIGAIRDTANANHRKWLDDDVRKLHLEYEPEFNKLNP